MIKAISSNKIIEAHFVEGINQANQLVLSLPLKERLKSNIFYALFEKPDSTEYLMFKLINEDVQNDRVTYNGVDAAYDELKGYGYVKDIRPVKRTAKEILQRVLQDTRWEVGYIDSTNPVDTNFYYQTYLDCIQQIVKLFNLEVTFTYGFDTRHQQITSRKVNLYLQQGRRTGKRFEYGSNLLEVTREEDSQNIVTALVGRGKGEEKYDDSTGEPTDGYGRRIGFSDVVWSKANGDPVDKPLGQEYVEDPEATKIFGYDDGKPRTGVIVFDDIDDPVELLKATWASLKSSDRPKVSFKAQVTDVGNLQLGDTIAIIRHEISIEYFTRVFKVDHDLLNKNNSTIEMGDDMSDRSLYSYISDVDATANQAVQSANQAAVLAGFKNKNYYSTTKPAIAEEGDNLWLNLGNGEFEHWVWHNHQWQFVNSTQDLKNVEQNVNSAKAEIEKAKQDIITNKEQANEAISTLTKTVTGIQGQVADGVSRSEFQALSNQVNLKVSKGDVVGQLNIDAGKTLIQNNKILLDADSVVFSGKAFIPDAAITNISADKINAGTLDAGKINVININADNIHSGTIVGNNSSWNLATGFLNIGDADNYVSIHDGQINLSQKKESAKSYFSISQSLPMKDDPNRLAASISAPDAVMLTLDNNGLNKQVDWDPYLSNDEYATLKNKNKGILVSSRPSWAQEGSTYAGVTISGGDQPVVLFGGDASTGEGAITMLKTVPTIRIGTYIYGLTDDKYDSGKRPNGSYYLDGINIEGHHLNVNTVITSFNGDLVVGGAKNAVVPTSQGMAAINAYETAEYYFGDIGKSKTDENGQVLIQIDPFFLETVNTSVPYHVFVSPYGNANVWVEQMDRNSFLVKSSKPNIEFSWEIKAKRKGYEDDRLKIINKIIPKELIPQYKEKGIL